MSTKVNALLGSVKHIRLFGSQLVPETSAVRWLLIYAGKSDAVEHLEVDVVASDPLTDEYRNRNPFQTVPFLEVVVDGTQRRPPGNTKRVCELSSWKPEAPCTDRTAAGAIIADPADYAYALTEAGAIATFLCEHFGIPGLVNPRGAFLRCRAHELIASNELLSRRIGSMVFLFLFTKAVNISDEDIVTAITAHERELLWSFRCIEEILTKSEATAAADAGVDYGALLAEEHTPPALGPSEQPEGHERAFTTPALAALNAHITGPSLSVADFVFGSYLQVLPYVQSWLPESLRQRSFPATMRYVSRMRAIPGHNDTLKPRLAFLKRFRRHPQIVARRHPMLRVIAARLEDSVDLHAQNSRLASRSDPRLLPQQHCRARCAAASPIGGGRRGRQTEVLPQWASRFCTAPVYSPCTLSPKDEEALRRSKRPHKARAHSASFGTTKSAAPSVDGLLSQCSDDTLVRSKTALPGARLAIPCAEGRRVWQHDPYSVGPSAAVVATQLQTNYPERNAEPH